MMKITLLLAAGLLGAALLASPTQAQAAGAKNTASATTSAVHNKPVKDELKELRNAAEAFRHAREAGDTAGERIAAQDVRRIWAELPEKLKERIHKKHPKLAERIEHLLHAKG